MTKNRIKELLIEKGMSQVALADRLGLSKASITQFLKIGNPRLETLQSIADVLNVPVWELLVSREEMKKTFSMDVFGVVQLNGVSYKIESTEDLERIIELTKKTPDLETEQKEKEPILVGEGRDAFGNIISQRFAKAK